MVSVSFLINRDVGPWRVKKRKKVQFREAALCLPQKTKIDGFFFEWNDLNCGLQRALEFKIALIMISALLYNLTIEQFLIPHFAWHLYQKFLL